MTKVVLDVSMSLLGVGPWGGTPWPGVPSFVVTHRIREDLLGDGTRRYDVARGSMRRLQNLGR
jgi:hypothetical protein